MPTACRSGPDTRAASCADAASHAAVPDTARAEGP